MVKVARLYHEHDVRQPEIARRLHISQARVSRLLKQAEADGIVRTTVVVPEDFDKGKQFYEQPVAVQNMWLAAFQEFQSGGS